MKSKFDQLESIVSDQRKGLSQPPWKNPMILPSLSLICPKFQGDLRPKGPIYLLKGKKELKEIWDGEL